VARKVFYCCKPHIHELMGIRIHERGKNVCVRWVGGATICAPETSSRCRTERGCGSSRCSTFHSRMCGLQPTIAIPKQQHLRAAYCTTSAYFSPSHPAFFCRRLPDGVRRYFEGKRQYDKAVQLYQKGGDMSRALEICFKAQLFDELRDIGK
jgi:hypothetical protein